MIIYSQKACKPCVELKFWLKQKGYTDYEELPLEDHIDKLMGMGFQAAPVVEINGTFVSGSLSNIAETMRKFGAQV